MLSKGTPETEPDLDQALLYIGDRAFRSVLQRYGCSADIEAVRKRLLGAAASPGRPADVLPIAEDLLGHRMPDPEDPDWLVLIGGFLALYGEIDETWRHEAFVLSQADPAATRDEVEETLRRRVDEVAYSFLEGIWADDVALPLSPEQAALLTALEEAAARYRSRLETMIGPGGPTEPVPLAELTAEIADIDREVESLATGLLAALDRDTVADRPPVTRAMALIEELAASPELPRDAIRECLARRDEMVPVFLRILRDHARKPGPHDEALFLIIHILGELGEQRAFAPLTDLLAGPAERIEALLGDAVTETIARVLIGVYDGDKERLYRLMDNPEADEYVRDAVFGAWSYQVAAGRIDRAEAERYLSDGFDRLRPREENMVWLAYAEAIARLGLVGLKGLARKAIDVGWVPSESITVAELEQILETASRSDDLVAFLGSERLSPFSDTIGAFSNWYGFSEDYLKRRAEADSHLPLWPQATQTVTNPYRKVGRNDPCPCGSGKKFKKCCLGLAEASAP